MNLLTKFSKGFAMLNAYIAYAALIIMMLFVGVAALSRGLNFPIVGDVEIVQITMVILVVGSMAYTELRNGHIDVGILVDNFPTKIQKALDIFSLILTVIFCAFVVWAFITRFETSQVSVLFGIPFYPIKILLILGFTSWAIVSIQKLAVLITAKEYKRFEE